MNIVVRNPVICAKSLSAIDILSSGRLFAAGVGPGSQRGDYDACGIPFEQRWRRFDEALEILHMLWGIRVKEDNNNMKSPTPSHIDYNGKYYQLKKIAIEPKPFQKPSSPYLHWDLGIRGWAEKRQQNMVMDGWHLLIISHQTSLRRNGRYFCLIGKHLVRTSDHLRILLCQCLDTLTTIGTGLTEWPKK